MMMHAYLHGSASGDINIPCEGSSGGGIEGLESTAGLATRVDGQEVGGGTIAPGEKDGFCRSNEEKRWTCQHDPP